MIEGRFFCHIKGRYPIKWDEGTAPLSYSTPDYDGDPNVYRWNYFYTPVQIGDDVVGVRIAVKDLATPKESQLYHWGVKRVHPWTVEGAE